MPQSESEERERVRDMGMDCDFVAKGETYEDIVQQAAEHARTAHNNQNEGAMLIFGADDTDNSRSVLPPGVSCRGERKSGLIRPWRTPRHSCLRFSVCIELHTAVDG
jgi:hypothetical protein